MPILPVSPRPFRSSAPTARRRSALALLVTMLVMVTPLLRALPTAAQQASEPPASITTATTGAVTINVQGTGAVTAETIVATY
ncbi:MAG: hypothetical protein ACTHMX_10015, partial [Thermomicrobiales bacterium]